MNQFSKMYPMKDIELFQEVIGLSHQWRVVDYKFDIRQSRLDLEFDDRIV